MRPCFEVCVVLLGVDTVEGGLHIVNGSTDDHLLHFFDVVLYLYFSILVGMVAMFAVDCVPEDISLEPFGVVECEVEVDFAIICLPDSDMSNFLNFLLVKPVSRCDLSLVIF